MLYTNGHLPLVSIVIPVYNGALFLAEAIDSALSQTYKNIEIIVVNDGSNDNGKTEQIALSFGDRIKYFHKPNGGVSSALNLAISRMEGEYFSWLSHDDKYAPNKIERQISLIKVPNDIPLCTATLIDANGNKIWCPRAHKNKITRMSGEQIFYEYLRDRCGLNGLGFLIPRTVFTKVGLFDEKMPYSQDVDLWMRIFREEFTFIYHPEALTMSRVHSTQATNTKSHLCEADRIRSSKKNLESLGSLTGTKKVAFTKLYYYRAIKVRHSQDAVCLKNQLKTMGEFTLSTRATSIQFYLLYYLKQIFRCLKQMIFAAKKWRN